MVVFGEQIPLGCTVRYLLFILCQLLAFITSYIYSGQVMNQYTNPLFRGDPMMYGCQVCCELSHGFQVAP